MTLFIYIFLVRFLDVLVHLTRFVHILYISFFVCQTQPPTSPLSSSFAFQAWSTLPLYPPLYLSTQTEYIPKPRLTRAQKMAQTAALAELDGSTPAAAAPGGDGFDTEGYFKGSGIPGADEVFERFLSRVGAEPEQVVR